ncbi:unnamed protein product, partial [Mesorhabditis belari]|uniref:Uncharacterized protein n=1 Tax=Mesorhabditis belari TaxID=2138241 RepID=A0AAF3FKX1_9BILA
MAQPNMTPFSMVNQGHIPGSAETFSMEWQKGDFHLVFHGCNNGTTQEPLFIATAEEEERKLVIENKKSEKVRLEVVVPEGVRLMSPPSFEVSKENPMQLSFVGHVVVRENTHKVKLRIWKANQLSTTEPEELPMKVYVLKQGDKENVPQ